MQMTGRKTRLFVALAAVAALSACTASKVNRAPVEDRGMTAAPVASAGSVAPAAPAAPPAAPPAATALPPEAGKPGYYVVQQGDTLTKIAFEASQPVREIVRWNNLSDPNVISAGQVLRVAPPPGDAGPPVAVATAQPAQAKSAPAVPVATQITPGAATPPSSAAAPTPPPLSAGADNVAFIWPVGGAVLSGFDEARNKGLNLAGKAGDPVRAAADGQVVYAGAGLRGYGNLIILQHNNTFLTAYAHNQKLLVKEQQTIKKGQKIAEMGSTDADRVQLHFEIRRSGKPVDPARYLPPR